MGHPPSLGPVPAPLAACLETRDALLIDGANSVCGASRTGFPHALHDGTFALAALLALAWLRRSGRALPFVGFVVAAAIPGLAAIACRRADAPLLRPSLSQKVVESLAPLLADADGGQPPVRLVRNDDGPYAPLFFFANPVHALPSDPPSPNEHIVTIGAGSLDRPCSSDVAAGALHCGDAPQ